MHVAGDQHRRAACEPHGHHYRLSRRCGAIVHGGVRHLHAGELANHRLEFEDGLQRALRYLRLVRCIRSEKLSSQDQRVDDHRAIVVVSTRTKKDGVSVSVFAGTLAEPVNDF